MTYLLREKLPSVRLKIPPELRWSIEDLGIRWKVYIEMLGMKRDRGEAFSEEDNKMLVYYDSMREALDGALNEATKRGPQNNDVQKLVGTKKPSLLGGIFVATVLGLGVGAIMGMRRR
jgi:hypothetical protein